MLSETGRCLPNRAMALRRLVGACDDSSRPGGLALGKNRSIVGALAAVKALAKRTPEALGRARGCRPARLAPRDRHLTGLLAPQPGRYKRFGTRPCAPVHVQPPRRCNFTARAKAQSSPQVQQCAPVHVQPHSNFARRAQSRTGPKKRRPCAPPPPYYAEPRRAGRAPSSSRSRRHRIRSPSSSSRRNP